MELLKEKGLDDVLVVVGGIIPDVDIPRLRAIGIDGIFLPGTPMQDDRRVHHGRHVRAAASGLIPIARASGTRPSGTHERPT